MYLKFIRCTYNYIPRISLVCLLLYIHYMQNFEQKKKKHAGDVAAGMKLE